MASIVISVSREPKDVEITSYFVMPDPRAGWLQTGEGTAVPTRLQALLHLADPNMAVQMVIRVSPGGRATVREVAVSPLDDQTSVTTTMLRRVPIDFLVRATLAHVARKTEDRPDIQRGAFRIEGDPEHQAWVSPTPPTSGRGREVPRERIARAVEAYNQALARGSKSPAEDVAAVMGYSRATAARDLRTARERGLLAPIGGATEATADQQGSGEPIWRDPVNQDTWEPLDMALKRYGAGPPVAGAGDVE